VPQEADLSQTASLEEETEDASQGGKGRIVSLTDEDIADRCLDIHKQRSSAGNSGLVQSVRREVSNEIARFNKKIGKDLESLQSDNVDVNVANDQKLQAILTAVKEHQINIHNELEKIEGRLLNLKKQ